VYPGYRSNVPEWVYAQMLEHARTDMVRDGGEDADLTRGPLISRFSFTIDTREWGFQDPRAELVRRARNRPEIREIAEADVWDERGEDRTDGREDAAFIA
jgi:hypothetical protein